MLIDTHIHIGDKQESKEMLLTSKYKNIYRLYACLNPEVIDNTESFVDKLDYFFAIPIVFCETDIKKANNLVLEYSKSNKSAVPVFLIDENKNFEGFVNKAQFNIFKEHFSLHSCEDVEKRFSAYDYISQNDGYLLLHTFSDKTYSYVQYLRKQFPNMRIIVAHLGRDSFGTFDYTKNMIDLLSQDEKIFTDISTIKNPALIQYAVKKYGNNRVLYGSDFPYEADMQTKLEDYLKLVSSANLTEQQCDNLLFNNAYNIIEETKILKKVR